MKKLFAAASYSFNNFYNNLNMQGQMIFSLIMFLIVCLCILLLITYVIQSIQAKDKIKKLKQEFVKPIVNNKEDIKKQTNDDEDTKIEEIATAISDALEKDKPISLTNFEEDQEKTAIISIDELIEKAKDLELIDDDNTGVNYLEKYNLEPAEVQSNTNLTNNNESKNEVKAFKVSQVISPIYGVKKEVINNDK